MQVSTLNVLAVSHCRAMLNNGYHYMHIWLVEALSLILHKANFFLQQRNKFYLTTNLVEILRMFLQLNPKIIIITQQIN